MKLQRYRINNCAEIEDDDGRYCLASDIEKLEAELKDMFSCIANELLDGNYALAQMSATRGLDLLESERGNQ